MYDIDEMDSLNALDAEYKDMLDNLNITLADSAMDQLPLIFSCAFVWVILQYALILF